MFSVVIPLYNKRESIKNTIHSVLNQQWNDFELVIVDDGSTDGSLELAEGIKDKRIILLKQTNAGVSAARNSGIRAAKYNYIAFLDADDFWEPDYMMKMAKLIRMCPDAALYGCAYDKVKGLHVSKQDFQLPADFMAYIDNYFDQARKHSLFWTSAVILNKNLYDDTCYFDENLHTGEDIDLWIRIACRHPVAFYNKVLAHYNLGAENRAMQSKRRYATSILSHLHKFDIMEREDASFRRYLNLLRIQFIPELFLHYDAAKQEIRDYLNSIDSRDQAFKHRLFLSLVPYCLKKIIVTVLYLLSFR